MTLRIRRSSRFKKDYKQAQRQGRDLSALKDVLEQLVTGKPLPQKYSDHRLSGKFKQYRECHIQGDWLLVYRVGFGVVELVRLGTHSELFK